VRRSAKKTCSVRGGGKSEQGLGGYVTNKPQKVQRAENTTTGGRGRKSERGGGGALTKSWGPFNQFAFRTEPLTPKGLIERRIKLRPNGNVK